eukprot:CAMPEP_0175075436 /NCGR_PEP_ID=MMETSP0052_2-20121109/22000_1 /TAXON_ID=51329 ORGANISM="Polytomella parva, Strain SAG 63-3" /NCGR_SAMPLE_ID=MMETSP0052_2 /ASSEMBLY_ACC=CAM_ASM_000194 /LENGTH=335 /DNA_ID=CAMNT_0016344123 /DNA_START=254 /DNA_END=1257 /DNA_ORIENTATION=+
MQPNPLMTTASAPLSSSHAPSIDAATEKLHGLSLVTVKYLLWQQAVDKAVDTAARDPNPSMDSINEIRGLRDELIMNPALAGAGEEAALNLGRRILLHLWEVAANELPPSVMYGLINTYVACLDALSKLTPRLPAELTALYWIEDDRRFDKNVVDALLRYRLLNLAELDRVIAKALTAGIQNNKQVTILVIHLIQTCVLKDSLFTCEDIPAIFEIFSKMAFSASASAGVQSVPRPAQEIPPIVRERGDPYNMRENTSSLFDEWVHAVNNPEAEKQCMAVLIKLRNLQIFQHLEATDYFFCRLIDISIGHCLAMLANVTERTSSSSAAGGGGGGGG